jgi:hypothetical protein
VRGCWSNTADAAPALSPSQDDEEWDILEDPEEIWATAPTQPATRRWMMRQGAPVEPDEPPADFTGSDSD